MRIQVLVATMNQKDHTLLEKMNIQSDAIIGNQCDIDLIEHFKWRNHKITYLNFAERGVGLNRNNALMRANGDICLFADDDIVYDDDYIDVVQSSFELFPNADVLLFNIKERDPKRYIIKQVIKIGYFNYLRYGTVRIAVRLQSIRRNGIYFNQCFGGGTDYCHGEDSLFLCSCLKKKLKIYGIPKYIASLTEGRASTWNKGYDIKYVQDQGKLYKVISYKWWWFLCIQDALRNHKKYNLSFWGSLKNMIGHAK